MKSSSRNEPALRVVLLSYADAPHGAEILKVLITARIDVAAIMLRGHPGEGEFRFRGMLLKLVRRARREGIRRACMMSIEAIKFLLGGLLASRLRVSRRYIRMTQQNVASIARRADIPVIRTHDHNDYDCIRTLKRLKPDVLVLAGASILKRSTIDIPRHGCINFHSSLLPEFRGPAPIFWQLWYGAKAGVTIHYVDEGIDTGDIILQREVDIVPGDTIETLHRRACVVGGNLVVKALGQIAEGTAQRRSQKGLEGSYYPRPTKEQEALLPQRLRRRWGNVGGISDIPANKLGLRSH